MKAAIYTRVSTNNQADEGYSLEAQHEELLKFLDSEKMTLVKVYTDPGVSAKSLKRPGIQEMIDDLKSGKFEALIIHKLDRLTRNISDLYDLVELVIKHDVKLISKSEQIDTSTPMGRMFIYMLGILAQMFRENLAQEIIKGQSVRASKGLRVSPARPYGYNLGGNLVMNLNDIEAHTVRQIFDWFNEGYTIMAIKSILNEKRISKKWHHNTIKRILENPTYLGVNHWKIKNATEGHYIKNAHEAIITEDVFNGAQEILKKREENFLSQSMRDFCFSAVVKCGLCGKSFSGWTRTDKFNGVIKKKSSYRCNGLTSHKCKIGTISGRNLTKLFLEFIDNFSFDVVEPSKVVSGRDMAKDKKRLEKLIAESDQVRLNYSRAMGVGKLEFEMFSQLIDEENKKTESWKQELEGINLLSPSDKKTRKDLLKLVDQLKNDWSSMTEMQKKMHIAKLFKFIVINKVEGEWKIIWYKLND